MTPKQELFVQHYLVTLNATQAALDAGYSKNTAFSIGHANLKKVEIKAAIAEAMETRSHRTEISADRVLKETARIALFDIRSVFDKDGRPIPIHELSRDTAAALSEVGVYQAYSGYGEHRQGVGQTTRTKPYDKIAALTLLMRHLGMLNDKVEHTVSLADLPPIVINRPK